MSFFRNSSFQTIIFLGSGVPPYRFLLGPAFDKFVGQTDVQDWFGLATFWGKATS